MLQPAPAVGLDAFFTDHMQRADAELDRLFKAKLRPKQVASIRTLWDALSGPFGSASPRVLSSAGRNSITDEASAAADGSPLILQVPTGEGKSFIIAVLASLLACAQKKMPSCKDILYVDVITSSQILAKRDALMWAPFFEALGVECGYLDLG